MSAKAWWTLGILAAPFLYVLTLPPLEVLARRAFHATDLVHYPTIADTVDEALDACEAPYWALAKLPGCDMPFLGYSSYWSDRLR